MTPSEIRDFRNDLELSQRDFAKALGVTQPAVQQWENGQAVPSKLKEEVMRRWRKNIAESGRQDWKDFLIGAAGGVGGALTVKVVLDYLNSKD